MTQVYHLCIAEKHIPGNNAAQRNSALEKAGAQISLKYRRGPIFPDNNNYLVFWWEDGKTYFSRLNTVRHGLDAFFFKDGHEMVECRDWSELLRMLPEFNEKGYVTTEFE